MEFFSVEFVPLFYFRMRTSTDCVSASCERFCILKNRFESFSGCLNTLESLTWRAALLCIGLQLLSLIVTKLEMLLSRVTKDLMIFKDPI